ncbi:MAG: bifunctional tRNA (5-methylaminomethyl-2-thiouridine)(34)-methyltransferase MnmD/FAD-dependent 5-carboxymethylaminomethyl-2-thiouridine(34) oxidoreductase MnmC [Thiotrichales bacterium]|nr:MAG: bifunctional tRNA (5-methylaminomethyl-2-thiouridine)(34)-methyltransferase MnmD/FAD-dependent 5-carboxymethylaminomethyl-2-thiouridine(34) oxidoreductase MnmC [Thiotrichales bacterium]
MKYAEIEWNNGTPRSTQFDDVYFSTDNGIEETRHVFLQQNELPQRWAEAERFVIAETGFGTGLNFLVTMQSWLESAPPDARLHYISIENQPVSPGDIARLAGQWQELRTCVDDLLQVYPPPVPGMHLLELAGGRIRLHLIFDDIEVALEQINYKVDAWYLDGFAPSRNPSMWSERVFELIGRNTVTGGSFATYTASGQVRRGMTQAGFVVQKTDGFATKRDMLKGFIFEQRCYAVEKPWFTVPAFTVAAKHAIIVGAGLAGLTAAWALSRRGWDITLIDRHASVAEEASGNPAGLLMPRLTQDVTADARFYTNAYLYAIRCLDGLQADAEQPFWFKCGNVLVDSSGRLRSILQSHCYPDNFVRYTDAGLTEAVTGVELNHAALMFVDAGWVDVKRLCRQLAQACGQRLRYLQANVTDLVRVKGHWQVVSDKSDPVAAADCVVVTNGAMANHIPVLEWLPIRAVRGQLTLVEQTDLSRNIKCGISAERYITPPWQGKHVIGASYQREGSSAELSASDQQENLNAINRLIPPGFVQSELTGRVSWRAVSDDRVPVVGCVPDRAAFEQQYRDLQHGRPSRLYPAGAYLPGLYTSNAHGSRGLASCFISGEIVASLICTEPVPVEKDILDHVNPARFVIRKLKRSRC